MDAEHTRSEQPLAVLFLLATALVVAGIAMAFRTGAPRGTAAVEVSAPPEVELPAEGSPGGADRPQMLAYGPVEVADGRIYLEQRAETPEGPAVSSTMVARIDQEREPVSDSGEFRLRRTYREVDVDVREGPDRVGPEIIDQVEVLLGGVVEEVRVDATGESSSHEWPTVSNPSVRQSLRLVRKANELIFPRFRTDAVNAGETWTYTFRTGLIASERASTPSGGIDVRSTFAGMVTREGRRLAVIRRDLELEGRATISSESAGEPRKVSFSGTGSGTVLFDVGRGAVAYSRVTFDRRTRLGGERREGGSVQEATYELVYWNGSFGGSPSP